MTLVIELGGERARKAGVIALIDESDAELILGLNWSLHRAGYAQSRLAGAPVLMHRLILGLRVGDGIEADHINRNRLDNRRGNLRLFTKRSESSQNRGANIVSTSRFRGVSWHKDTAKWRAHCKLNGRQYHLGLFADELEATRVAAAFRVEHMPFSVENLIEEEVCV